MWQWTGPCFQKTEVHQPTKSKKVFLTRQFLNYPDYTSAYKILIFQPIVCKRPRDRFLLYTYKSHCLMEDRFIFHQQNSLWSIEHTVSSLHPQPDMVIKINQRQHRHLYLQQLDSSSSFYSLHYSPVPQLYCPIFF